MKNILSNAPKNIFLDKNYKQMVVQYQGDIMEEIKNIPGFYVTIISDSYAVISLPKNKEISLGDKDLKSIVYIRPEELYILESISPMESAEITYFQIEDNPLYLTGKQVTIGVIDTGIDYLNQEFMNASGFTRIKEIWDQNINSEDENVDSNVLFGSVYSENKINEAIVAMRKGEDPYKIVATKDEIGHGTSMTGIMAGTGNDPRFKGAAPNSDIVVVNLLEAGYESEYAVPVYNLASIFTAIQYLVEYAKKNEKPMIIYLPLGNNAGNHKGGGLLEDYIDSISINIGIVFVTGAGNEGASGGHTSGIITKSGLSKLVPLYISPEQKKISVSIWVDLPDIMTLDIISPSGEESGTIPTIVNTKSKYTFVFEKTNIEVYYYLPEESSGDELIRVVFKNLQPGTWNLKLTASSVVSGKFNAWIPVRGITVGDTKFLSPDPYKTMTDPGTATSIITVASYNQNNNNWVNSSGWEGIEDPIDRIDVAAGGVNIQTIAPNNKIAIVNGTSVAAAVVVGACALLFEWGIIDGNDPYMNSQTLKTYITTGTYKRSGDTYPNAQWGYGALKMLGIFGYIK